MKNDVREARNAYASAQADFNAIVSDMPSGLPGPDGTYRIRNAANSYRAALDTYQETLQDLDNFLKNGIVPERLKDDR